MIKTMLSKTMRREKLEARLVGGMYAGERRVQSELYDYCSRYFYDNYRSVFFSDEKAASEIFQNSFIALWENIERRRLYVSGGRVMGRDGMPLDGSILTYFMGIARIKYLEWTRESPPRVATEAEAARGERLAELDARQWADLLYGPADDCMYEIVADVVSHMSERCSEIIGKFYYEGKDLDTILAEIPAIGTKDALKTRKYKCMETLRNSARDIYRRYLNS